MILESEQALREQLLVAQAAATVALVRDGCVNAIFMLFGDKGPVGIAEYPGGFKSDAQKDYAFARMRELAREKRAVSVLHVGEAWSATVAAGAPLRRARDLPHREEIVLITVQRWDGKGMVASAPIRRDPDGRAVGTGEWTTSGLQPLLGHALVFEARSRVIA